jgi:hypothetical protein
MITGSTAARWTVDQFPGGTAGGPPRPDAATTPGATATPSRSPNSQRPAPRPEQAAPSSSSGRVCRLPEVFQPQWLRVGIPDFDRDVLVLVPWSSLSLGAQRTGRRHRAAIARKPPRPGMGCWSGSGGVFEQVPVPRSSRRRIARQRWPRARWCALVRYRGLGWLRAQSRMAYSIILVTKSRRSVVASW